MHQPSPPPHALRGLRALLNGLSQVFLLSHAGCGLLVLLPILIGAPHLLGGALLGGCSSMLTAQRRGYPQADIDAGLYGYNGILLGLLVSAQFSWSPLLPLPIILGAGLSSLILAPWLRCMRQRQWLPALTFPFVALSWLLLGICLALLLQPGFGALGLPPLTMPFILACWLIQASRRALHQAAIDCTPVRRD